MANYTSQDLQDNLDYLEITKQKIRSAIVSKGVEVSDDDSFRSYADKILSIETDAQDLASIIDEQDALIEEQANTIAELESALVTKASEAECYLYAFCRDEEPTIYNGVWFKKHLMFNKFIISNLTQAEILQSTFEPDSIVLKTGTMYETLLLGPMPDRIVGTLNHTFDMVYLTDEDGKVITDMETYYGDGTSWYKIN